LIVILPQVVGIFKYKAEGSIPPETSNSKIEPVFGIAVVGDIGIALYFDGEGVAEGDGGRVEVAAGEAAVDDYVVVQIEVVSVGVPYRLFLLVATTFVHLQ